MPITSCFCAVSIFAPFLKFSNPYAVMIFFFFSSSEDSYSVQNLLPHWMSRLTSGSIQTLNNPWTTACWQCFFWYTNCLQASSADLLTCPHPGLWSCRSADLLCSDSWSATCRPVPDNSFLCIMTTHWSSHCSNSPFVYY